MVPMIFRRGLASATLRSWSQKPLQKSLSTSARQFRVTLDGQTLYIEKEMAEALGWSPDVSTDGVTLRLSGWEPGYFAITPQGTEADLLARGTVESSRNPNVQAVLEYLKKSDSE